MRINTLANILIAIAVTVLASTNVYATSTTCNQMDIKSPTGEEKGFGYPTEFKEDDSQVRFLLANKRITLPPFHEVSDGVYGTKAATYVLVKKFLGSETVFILQIKSSGEKILFRECQ